MQWSDHFSGSFARTHGLQGKQSLQISRPFEDPRWNPGDLFIGCHWFILILFFVSCHWDGLMGFNEYVLLVVQSTFQQDSLRHQQPSHFGTTRSWPILKLVRILCVLVACSSIQRNPRYQALAGVGKTPLARDQLGTSVSKCLFSYTIFAPSPILCGVQPSRFRTVRKCCESCWIRQRVDTWRMFVEACRMGSTTIKLQLVVGLEHVFFFPIFHILGIIIPTDKYFQRGRGVETTNQTMIVVVKRVLVGTGPRKRRNVSRTSHPKPQAGWCGVV